MELAISTVLRLGIYTAAAFILVGLGLTGLTGDSGYNPGNFPTSLSSVFNGLIQLKPGAIISFGLLLLITTPITRVALSVILFLLEKDYLYVALTLIVLAILLFSLLLGKTL